jgi:hypothetical protein
MEGRRVDRIRLVSRPETDDAPATENGVHR